MIPAGYIVAPSRALLYQHCRGYDPLLLRTRVDEFAVWCPVCERLMAAPTAVQAVSDWNDHCIARLSAGKGT